MSSHGYLIPIMAAAFMITNLFGAIFTISRIYSRRIHQGERPSTGASRSFAPTVPFRSTTIEDGVLQSAIFIKWGQLQVSVSGRLAITAIAILAAGLALGLWLG
jgi:hypothetical protein